MGSVPEGSIGEEVETSLMQLPHVIITVLLLVSILLGLPAYRSDLGRLYNAQASATRIGST